jgi:hypothetical protein
VPPERAAQLQSVLVRKWSAKDLIRSIVLADDFAVSHVDTDDPERDVHALFKARPWQLARLIADLTGFRWEMDFDFDIGWGRIGHVDLMTDAFLGFEVLSGGIDGVNVTLPSYTMNASSSIVLDEQVVENDFQWMDSRKLLTRIGLDDTSESAVREQLAALQGRLFGTLAAVDSADTTRAWQLFQAALGEAGGDAKRAWKTVLYAMLQDPKVVYY